MTRITMIAAVTAFLASSALAADPAVGIWKTQPDDNGNFGHVKIAECGAKICGTLMKAFNSTGASRPSDHIGRQIVWDMQSQAGGKYVKGKIYAPDRDKTYGSKMQLDGNALVVSGCVFAICRKQNWSRVN